MKEQINKVIEFLKEQPVEGCIAGSCLLDYFPDQDVDCFLYDISSFTEMFYILKHNPMFVLADKVQKWSANKFRKNIETSLKKNKIISIKFLYNTCVTVNLVIKSNADNIYSVLSSFDMDIICKGYDLLTKETFDFTYGSTITKKASWNKLNKKFYDPELWNVKSILRQIVRVFKYFERGYDVDNVILKYIELSNNIQELENIFDSPRYEEFLKPAKINTLVIKNICECWLQNHTISEKELELLKLTIKQL